MTRSVRQNPASQTKKYPSADFSTGVLLSSCCAIHPRAPRGTFPLLLNDRTRRLDIKLTTQASPSWRLAQPRRDASARRKESSTRSSPNMTRSAASMRSAYGPARSRKRVSTCHDAPGGLGWRLSRVLSRSSPGSTPRRPPELHLTVDFGPHVGGQLREDVGVDVRAVDAGERGRLRWRRRRRGGGRARHR